jgi:hypothetical protein
MIKRNRIGGLIAQANAEHRNMNIRPKRATQDDKFTLAGFRHGRNANKKTKASSRSTQPRAG